MQKKQTHIMYGFLTALAYIIVSVVLYLAGLGFETWAMFVVFGVLLAGIILNAIAFSNANDNYVSFGNVFSSGFKASAIITLVLIVWSFISMKIFPEMREKGIEIARERMLQQNPNMSEEQIDKMSSLSSSPLLMVAGVLFMTMFVGAIFSLLGAAIAKKKGDNPPPQVLS